MSSSCTLRVRLGFRKPSGFVFCCCVMGHHALGRHRGSGALARLCRSHNPHATAALAPAGESSPDALGPPQDCVAGRFLFLAFPFKNGSFWLYPSLNFLTAAHGPGHMGPPPQGSVPPQSQQGSTVAAAFCHQEPLCWEVRLPRVDSL